MADVRTLVLEHLHAGKGAGTDALAAALKGVDLAAARGTARVAPASAEAVATVIGCMVLTGAAAQDLVEAAKAAAQRAPREDEGNDVALLAGAVIWAVTEQPQLAEPYYRRVRRADPADAEVLAFYRELFAGDQGATQLIQVLVQARRATKDAELRFTLAEEVAKLAEQQGGSIDRAIETWRSVIREDGWEPRAAAALERLYRQGGKWTALVDLLKEEIEKIPDGSGAQQARIDKLLEIASLYRDKLKLDTMALATLQRILDIDPRHEASLEALAETYARAGRHNDLLGVYGRRIDAAREAGDRDREVELLRRVAEIWLDQLGNPQRALEPLTTVLQLAPKDPKARALLARIHEQRRDFRALVALRREDLEGTSGDEALALRIELAQLCEERLGDRREAIEAWNEVLAHHGDHDGALQALARLYERESRWSAAAEICHRQLARAEGDEAMRLLVVLGNIYSDRLQNRADAVRVWAELLRMQPGHERAIRRLRDAYVQEARWDDIVALYAGSGRLADAIEVLQGAADRVSSVEERVSLYRRIAGLCRDRLGQPERALKALERTLAIQPDNLAVARELLPIYREQRNWARLLGTYEVLLRAASEVEERLQIIASMRSIAEQQLNSPALTLQWSAEAYRLRPEDAGLRAALESAAERADGWDELTRIFEARIGTAETDDAERLLLLDKLAVVARDKLVKPDDAQRYFRRIIALDPANSTAMKALEDIYSTTRRWEDLADVYRRRLEVEHAPEARLATLRALAQMLEQQLGDLAQAVVTWAAILELDPADAKALDSLARIHRNRGDWAELATALARKLDLGEVATTPAARAARVPIMFELAQLHATRLGDSDRAVSGFLGVLELEPTHRGSVEALETLRRADPSTSVPIMRGLLPYYRRIDDRRREAEAMEVIVAVEEDPKKRLELFEQLAASYERMDDRREDALRIRGELFGVEPERWQGRQALQKLGNELGRMDGVAHAYTQVLATLAEEAARAEAEGRTMARERSALRRDLLLELAAILRDRLGRSLEAERAYGEVLEQDETHQGAYEALEALLRARSAHEELVKLYRRRVDVTFNQREQKELLTRIVDLSRNVLGDRATALRTAEELLDLIPDDLATIAMLAQMYEESGDMRELAKLEELLGRWAELADDATSRRLEVKRAYLRMSNLGDAFGACDLLGQVVGEDPDDALAKQLLEELLMVSEVQLQACSLLEPIYSRQGNHAGRIRVLHVRREHAEAAGMRDEAVSHLREVANIHERELDDTATAFTTARDAYLMDPNRADTRAHVERLGMSLRRHGELVEVWRRALASDRVDDRSLRIDLTRRIAELLDELGDPGGARTAWTDLVALDPSDAKLARRAVEALCRLHLEAGDGPALIEAKRALLRFADGTDERVRIRLEIAEIQEQLGDRIGAATTYGEVLDMEPSSVGALDALERLFLDEQEWERLCQVLAHRIGVTPDARARAAIWRQLGEIQRDQLADANAALASFQSILELKIGREDTIYALESLVALNEKLERWPDVEDGLRKLVGLADRDALRAKLVTKMAFVMGRKLGRSQDALEALKRVLDIVPTDQTARAEVTGYLDGDDTRERALRILMPLYEAEQNWGALLQLEELQARKQPSGRRRLRALLRVAKTQEERIGDPQRAFSVLCEAMAEAADQAELVEILDKVERLGSAPERAEALLEAYASTVDRILDADLQRRVLRSMGHVALDRLDRPAPARTAYERLLELAPDEADAADALERIYVRQEDHEALAVLLTARADRAREPAARDGWLIRAARIHEQLGRPETAIRLYERLSDVALARAEVQDALEPLYESSGRWRELAAHLGRKLTRLTGRAACDCHLRLGRLYGQRLDDPETGIRHMSTALRLDPDHAVATEELGRYLEDPAMRGRVAEMLEPVFAAVGDWNRLIQIQEIRLAEATHDDARIRILLRIAQIEEEQLEDLDRAFESYTRLFREQPHMQTVRDQLGRLAGVLGESARYAELLTQHVTETAAADDSDETLAIVREAADLWLGGLRQADRAVPLLRRLLAARPDDTTVFPALENALGQAEKWRDLAEAYWREVDASVDVDRQTELLRKLATLATELLEDPAEAARAWQRMLEIRPDYDMARVRLENIYTGTGRFRELLDLLRDRMAQEPDVQSRSRVALRIAAVQDEKLDEPDGAVDTLESVLAESPNDDAALAMLEQIANARSPMRARILAILRPIYEGRGSIRRLVEIDEWRLAHESDPTTRHELYNGIAELLARSQDTRSQAFEALCRAVAEPGPEDALERLDAFLTRMVDQLAAPPARLADALVAAAGGDALVADGPRRINLLVWAARIRMAGADATAAAQILRDALRLDEERVDALELLDSALVRLGEHDALADVLRRRAKLSTDDRERLELLRRLGVLLEDAAGRPDEAEAAWREMLDIEPTHREALRRLERAYERRGAQGDLVETLEREIDVEPEASERRRLRMRLAGLLRDHRGDRTGEIDVLRALLGDTPGDAEALAQLTIALVAEDRHGEAADVLDERANLAGSNAAKADLSLECARLHAGPIGDLQAAIGKYAAALELVPGHEGAVADLIVMAEKSGSYDLAGSLVAPQLVALGRFADLARVYVARAALSDEPTEKIEALRQLARVRLDRLSDPDGAMKALDELSELLDDVEQLREVLSQSGQLAVHLGRTEQHVDRAAMRAADENRPTEERLAVADHAARLAEEVAGDSARALAILRPLVAAGLAGMDLCARVERLARATGTREALELALREAARIATDPPEQAAALVRLGDVLLGAGDREGALESFRDAFDAAHDRSAVAGLERVLESSGTNPATALLDALDAAYQELADRDGQARVAQHRLRSAEGSDRLRLLEQLAALREQASPDEALEAMAEMVALDPESTTGLERMLGLARESGRLARGVDLLLRSLGTARSGGTPATALSLQIATVLLRDLGDARRALATLDAVLEADPENLDALELSSDAARQANEAEILHDTLARRAKLDADPTQSAKLWADAARVAEADLRRADLAIADLEQQVAVDEGDAAAWRRLLGLLAEAGDHARLVDALGRRVGVASDPDERKSLRHTMAEVLVDELGRHDDAANVYQDVLADDPSDARAIAALEAVQRKLERWDDVRQTLERKLDATSGDDRIAVLLQLAELAEERIGDRIDAIERYQEVLVERPGHVDAEARLERLLAAEDRHVDLDKLLEERMQRCRQQGDVEGHRAAATRRAELLAGELGDSERAQEILQELLELDGTYVPAILALSAVYEARGDEGAMRLSLQRAAALDPKGPVGAQVQLRLAKLAGNDRDKKREHLEAALRLDAGNVAATEQLGELYRAAGQWGELVTLLESLENRAEDDARRRQLALDRVDVILARLGDAEAALGVLAPIYATVQDDPEINRRIADALYTAERWDEAAGMYNWLVEIGRRGKRNKILGHYLTRLGEIAIHQDDIAAAREQLLEAYRIDTTNVETLMALGSIYEHNKEWSEALKIYRTMLLQNADQSGLLRRGDIYINLARAHVMLEEKPKARAMLRRGLEEDAGHPTLGQELKALGD